MSEERDEPVSGDAITHIGQLTPDPKNARAGYRILRCGRRQLRRENEPSSAVVVRTLRRSAS